MLLVRPTPFEGESPVGFLHRVARANGYVSTRQLLGMMRRDDTDPMTELGIQLGLPTHALFRLSGMPPGRWTFERDHMGMDAADFNWIRKRWCPACLKEHPDIFFGAWTQKLACCCLLHQCWLCDRCAACGAFQPWSDPSLRTCRCGARLYEVLACEAEGEVLALAGGLAGQTAWPQDSMSSFAHLTMKQLSKLVRLLGRFGAELRPAKVGKTPDLDDLAVARGLAESASHLLSAWPTNFWELLCLMQNQNRRDPSLSRTFDPLYRVLYKLLPGVAYQFMRDAFEDYLHEHWWGLVCKRNRRLKPSTRTSHPRLTLDQAASRFEGSYAAVKCLVSAQKVASAVVVHPSGRKTTSVLFDEMAALQEVVNGCLTLTEAARDLQLSESRTRQLIEQGLLPTLVGERSRGNHARWMIPRSGIEHLMFSCRKPALGTATIAVRGVLKRWRLSAQEAAALVLEVQSGRLQPFGASGCVVPVGEVLLCRADVQGWLGQFQLESDVLLSVTQAAQLLALKQQVVYDLVGRGVLPHVRGQRGERLVERKNIRHFQRTYVSLAALAKGLKTSARALLTRLKAQPITGPSVDGARQYFYRCQDVEELMRFPIKLEP